MSRLSNHLSVLVSNPEFSDVVFDVDGHKVHGHRAILSARSEYFRAMFSEDTQMYCGTITVSPRFTTINGGSSISDCEIPYRPYYIILYYIQGIIIFHNFHNKCDQPRRKVAPRYRDSIF